MRSVNHSGRIGHRLRETAFTNSAGAYRKVSQSVDLCAYHHNYAGHLAKILRHVLPTRLTTQDGISTASHSRRRSIIGAVGRHGTSSVAITAEWCALPTASLTSFDSNVLKRFATDIVRGPDKSRVEVTASALCFISLELFDCAQARASPNAERARLTPRFVRPALRICAVNSNFRLAADHGIGPRGGRPRPSTITSCQVGTRHTRRALIILRGVNIALRLTQASVSTVSATAHAQWSAEVHLTVLVASTTTSSSGLPGDVAS
jgi:hypothetical protein